MFSHLESNNFFFAKQHAFRRGLSCETQLLELTTDLHFNMDSNLQTHCIFLDLSKAFDCIAHCRLFIKLSAIKLDSLTLSWLWNFLSNRQQFTMANNVSSSFSYVSSGVPQGSVLGPLLFLIYINDLPNNISSCMRIFADDCIIYRPIHSSTDHMALQEDLNLITDWCDTWLMHLNSTKCKVMSFSRKHSKSNLWYNINNSTLSEASSFKYLGITLTLNLSWTTHITNVCASAAKSLGYLRRNLRKLASQTFIHPQLEFSSSIWSPHQKYLITSLKSIRNRATRFTAQNFNYHSSVTKIKLSPSSSC